MRIELVLIRLHIANVKQREGFNQVFGIEYAGEINGIVQRIVRERKIDYEKNI